MANNIKGITIKFEGDTTSLGRALSDINKKAKGVDRDLREVNKALKFNPKNTELIAQKQALLKDKISQTRQQLEAFKAAQAKLDADKVDKNSQEYMELRRQIIETESKLTHFQDELKKTNAIRFEQVGQQVQQVGDKMQAVGKGMTKYVTGPILAVGAASVKSFNEVQDGLKIVAQKTGATGAELDKMQESARNLAKTIPTDFETAGTAIGEVSTRFHVTGQELEDLSGQFIKFAKVNNTDVNTSIDQVQKALSAFGLTAKDAPALLDAMTRAGQNTGVKMETLQSGLIQNAAALQELGLGINQSVNFMAQLETSGANSETVMQGLRKALKNAAKEGKPLDQALGDLQNTILNGTDGMDGLTAAYDLFGKSGDQIFNAVKNGSLDFQALSQSALDSQGALDAVFTETLTPADQFQMTMNTMKDTLYQVGSTIMELLAPFIEALSEKIKQLNEWWQSLDPTMQDTIIKVAGVAAAIGPLLIVMGKIASGIGAIISILPMLVSPAGIAVAAIAGIIAIGVLLYKNWDKIKEKAAELRDWLKEKWENIKTDAKAAWDKFLDIVLWPFRKIKEGWEALKAVFKGGLDIKAPHIPLPHFSIQPKGWRFRDLLEGDIPSLGIDWYAKGGIFKSPTVIGVGEAGAEAVLPLDRLNGMLGAMADSIVNGINTGAKFNSGAGEIVIPIYLYPSGPKMGEETVKMYDTYKRQLG